MANDDENVLELMRTSTLAEILSNEMLWGADLGFMKDEVGRYADKD